MYAPLLKEALLKGPRGGLQQARPQSQAGLPYGTQYLHRTGSSATFQKSILYFI